MLGVAMGLGWDVLKINVCFNTRFAICSLCHYLVMNTITISSNNNWLAVHPYKPIRALFIDNWIGVSSCFLPLARSWPLPWYSRPLW